MEESDHEELVSRRLAERVEKSVDEQIKSRYFWAAVAFGVATWLGGSALINGMVQSSIAERVNPPVYRAVGLADQASEELKRARDDVKKDRDDLKKDREQITDLETRETKLETNLSQSEDREKRLETSVEIIVFPINQRIKELSEAVAELQAKSNVAARNKPQILIRFGGVTGDFAKQIADKISAGGKYLVSGGGGGNPIGASGVRYFYQDDKVMADEIARDASESLQQLGISGNKIPTLDLSGLPIKPPNRTFELWLNVSGDRLITP